MKGTILVLVVAVTLTLTLTSCTAKEPATTGEPAAGQATTKYTDPFAYCRSVIAVDAPDARYTGEKIPVTIVKRLQQAMALSDDMPLDLIAQGSSWRCMDGQVYACNSGANIPCQGKADVSRTPNAGSTNWCREHPNAGDIPAAATGRETVFAWRCRGATPEVVKQTLTPDARGFVKEFWHALEPPPAEPAR